jgi:chemotaxis protein MotB
MKYRKREQVNWWMSYADLMSAMVMILALALAVVIFQVRLSDDNAKKAEAAAKQSEHEIQQVIGLKTEIIKQLTDTFRKSNMQIEIDQQTGAIRFPGSVLFDTDSANISAQGQQYLKRFVPLYFGVLLQPKFRDKIADIIIEGHTDNQGTYMYNMELSQARAFSVLQYIYSDKFPDFPYRTLSQKYVTCDGRSFSRPLYDKNGHVDAARSRRVEFLFRLKDEQAFQAIERLVNGQ